MAISGSSRCFVKVLKGEHEPSDKLTITFQRENGNYG